jgi:hypothetical protein
MHYGLASDFGAARESRGLGAGDLAFRCGLPDRGYGRPIRNADPGAKLPAHMATGTPVQVRWLPQVSWRKRIRYSKRK